MSPRLLMPAAEVLKAPGAANCAVGPLASSVNPSELPSQLHKVPTAGRGALIAPGAVWAARGKSKSCQVPLAHLNPWLANPVSKKEPVTGPKLFTPRGVT